MTTITIESGLSKDSQTKFKTARELFIYLRESLSPVSIFLVDDTHIPESIRSSIEKAEQEGENNVIDFTG